MASKKDTKQNLSLDELKAELEIAKKELYKVVATAKLGQPSFEVWRKKCLELTTKIERITKEEKKWAEGGSQ